MSGNRGWVTKNCYSHKKVRPDKNQVENLLFGLGDTVGCNNLFEEFALFTIIE